MSEKGLSPVIGVILMLCITVILAAVIAAFVFSEVERMEGPENKIAGIVTDRYSYDGENLFIDITSMDYKTGSEIKQTLWTTDPVLFHHINTGERYILTTQFPSYNKYPELTGVV